VQYAMVVEVSLRHGIADPEGATIERALPTLGFSGVSDVRAGKAFRLLVDANSADEAIEKTRGLATRLLSNPVIEDAHVRIDDES